jgi:hypothetical protein
MRSVVGRALPSAWRLLVVVACATALGAMPLPARAQDVPLCSVSRTSDCRLPPWTASAADEAPSLFGRIDGTLWVDDEQGDAPVDGLDILGVGFGRVDIEDPTTVRRAAGLLKLGKAKRAVRPGANLLVRVVLDRPPSTIQGDHAGIHLTTDVDGSRSNNVPSGVNRPDFPFAGSQVVYSLTWAPTTGQTRLLQSDLGRRDWYKGTAPFAAAWSTPTVLDVLVAPSAMGEDLRVVTHAAGDDGGYDVVSLGPAAIPARGVVGLVPACVEGSIANEAVVVPRLSEGGQAVQDVEAPAAWRGGARVPMDDASRAALRRLISEQDDDGDERVGIPAWVSLFEEGVVIRQRHDLELAVDGDDALIGLGLGLIRRGYAVLRDFEPEPTGDAALDGWLERATDAVRETMPPFRATKKEGLLLGGTAGACVPWLAPAPHSEPAPSTSSSGEPADGA